MDQDEELAKFKWILVVGIALIMTGCYSLNELRYAVWGKSVEAKVTGAKEVTNRGRRGRTSTALRIDYQFSEAGGASRTEHDEVSTDWPLSSDGKVTVQYIPGAESSSRLLGHSNMFSVYLFLGCIACMAIAVYKVSLYVNDDGRSSKKRRRT
ncbi:MAG: hypothetical protein JWN70_3702 [Planctomycetaceae bacterium]|nr:hypothetical protein [Planctomycetaceae bacterium]